MLRSSGMSRWRYSQEAITTGAWAVVRDAVPARKADTVRARASGTATAREVMGRLRGRDGPPGVHQMPKGIDSLPQRRRAAEGPERTGCSRGRAPPDVTRRRD